MTIGDRRIPDSLRALALALAPRPVVLVSTLSLDGVLNLAPFSSVMPLSAEPSLLGVGISPRSDGGVKATLRNIVDLGEFVVNTTGLALLTAAVGASLDHGPPPAGRFETVASHAVRPPRVVGAAAQLECRLTEIWRPQGSKTSLVVGEVVCLHFDDRLLPNETGALAEALPGHLTVEAPGVHRFLVGGRLLEVRAEAGHPTSPNGQAQSGQRG